jgi:ribosomal protein S27AE
MKTMSMEMSEKPCERCKAKAEEVINAEERKRVGWYCLKCHFFEKAILRETKL